MRSITIPWPDPNDESLAGSEAVVPVLIDWFPSLTDDQQVQNALAAADGRPLPHPDPNLVEIRLAR